MTPQDRLAAALAAANEAIGLSEPNPQIGQRYAKDILAADPTIAADMEEGRLIREDRQALSVKDALDAPRLRAVAEKAERVLTAWLDWKASEYGPEKNQHPFMTEPTSWARGVRDELRAALTEGEK